MPTRCGSNAATASAPTDIEPPVTASGEALAPGGDGSAAARLVAGRLRLPSLARSDAPRCGGGPVACGPGADARRIGHTVTDHRVSGRRRAQSGLREGARRDSGVLQP